MWKPPARHLFALVAGLIAATGCGKGEPRWAKTADQIDREQWKAACGRKVGTFTRPEEGRIEEMFDPDPSEAGRLVHGCEFAYRSSDHALVWARYNIYGDEDDAGVATARAQQLALLRDLLPPSVHASLDEIANGSVVRAAKVGGFFMRGGAGRRRWEMEVSVRRIY